MSKVIFGFIGPAGSGKSTQARLLADTLGCRLLNVGQELRKSSNEELISIMKKGEFVADSYIFEIIESAIDKMAEDDFMVIDGFFRKESEVKLLGQKQRELHLQVGALFDLGASDEIVTDRLIKRARLDDDKDGIATRLGLFKREREGVLRVAEREGIKVIAVDGEGTIDHIRDEILEHLKEYVNV